MKARVLQFTAVSVLSLGLTLGVFASAGANGYDWRRHSQGSELKIEIDNDTDLRLKNATSQNAVTGSVEVSGGNNHESYSKSRHHSRHNNQNTVVGDVTTGNASNSNSTNARINVASDSDVSLPEAPAAAADQRRHSSPSQNETKVEVDNDTDVSICNTTEQNAVSGSVSISGAKSVGDITTGNASNTNTTEFVVTVGNDTSVN